MLFGDILTIKSQGKGIRSLHLPHATRGISRGFKLVHQQEPKSFLRQVRSPGHLLFFASNVALLLHVKYITTANNKAEMEKHLQRMHELENYEEVIKNLDAEEEAVRSQIKLMKARISRDDSRSVHIEHEKINKHSPASRRESLKSNYFSQRAAISPVLRNPSMINKLFQDHPQQKISEDLSELCETPPENKLSYSSTISPSLVLLSNMFIKTFLVEINLRNSFDDTSLSKIYSKKNYLLNPDLFQSMKNDSSKETLYAKLIKLRGRSHTLANPIWRHLDEHTFKLLRLGFQRSEHFRSKESMRLDYLHNKSGKCLNYDSANKSRHILAIQAPVFYSDVENNAAYIQDFRKLFAIYKADNHPMKHLNLLLSIAHRLTQNGQYIPHVSIFRELFELFENAKLYNYSSLIYDTLPEFEHINSILADGEQPHQLAAKKVNDLSSVLHQDPRLLGSLIQHNIAKNDTGTLKFLLQFLVPTRGPPRSNFILPAFMSTWDPKSTPHESESKELSLMPVSVIECAIEACIQLKKYDYIDRVLAKLVYDSVQDLNAIGITFGNSAKEGCFISQTFSETSAKRKLFTDKIILLLGKAYLEAGDKLRCNWLASLIDDCLGEVRGEEVEMLREDIIRFTKNEEEATSNPARNSSRLDLMESGASSRGKRPVLLNLAESARSDTESRSVQVQNGPSLQEVYVA